MPIPLYYAPEVVLLAEMSLLSIRGYASLEAVVIWKVVAAFFLALALFFGLIERDSGAPELSASTRLRSTPFSFLPPLRLLSVVSLQ